MSKTTMKDIAEKLNISINAVSLALNDKEGVSQELRMQILELAVIMGYSQKKLNAKTILKNKTICVMIENKKKNKRLIASKQAHRQNKKQMHDIIASQ